MLREYRLTNFKAFGETVTIPIRPLTLIFGANSSGKSSIFQSLLLLKQTLEEAESPETVLLPEGPLVDLGTYSDFVHRHRTALNFEFRARFSLQDINARSPLLQKIFKKAKVTDAGVSVQFLWNEEKRQVIPHRVAIALGAETSPLISYASSELSERYANPSINAESDFWHHWWKETKNHVADQISNSFVVSSLGKSYVPEDYPVETDEPPLKDFEQILEDYPVDDAIKHLSEASLHHVAGYRNFLPIDRHIESWKANVEISNQLTNSLIHAAERAKITGKQAEISQLAAQIKDADRDMQKNHGAMENIREKSPFEAEIYVLANYASDFNDTGGAYEENRNIHGLDISPITHSVCSTFQRLLEDVVYLGPLRKHPERSYRFRGDTPEYVGQTGEYLPSILFKNPERLEQINSDLKALNVRYSLKLSPHQYEDLTPTNDFSLHLVDQGGVSANVRDVGFGISQVLPIVVQNRLSQNKTLLIEQPEIHLHPAQQAELGDMFIRSALGEQHNTLLLETHSECLILRILRRMRDTANGSLPEGIPPVRPEDVAILYVQNRDSTATVQRLEVDEEGQFLDPWPNGFFEEGFHERFS